MCKETYMVSVKKKTKKKIGKFEERKDTNDFDFL